MKKLPHILVTLLVCIMVGCGSSNPFADEAQKGIENRQFESALTAAEQSIKERPGDPRGYYYKAVALGEIAGQQDPLKRAELYKQMNEFFDKARTVADTAESVPSEMERISSVKNLIWQTEHNRAVQFVRSDSLKNTVEQPMSYSMAHLKNATIVQPDSSLSWNVLSSVSAMNKDYQQAVDAKTQYISMTPDSSLEPTDFIDLASFHFQMDNQQEVLQVFERAQKHFPQNEEIVSNLADAYNRVGEPEKARATVRELVEKFPENPQYHLVLGTQIYQQALDVGDTLSTNSNKILKLQRKLQNASDSEKQNIQGQISKLVDINQELQSQLDELTAEAEDELKTTLEYRPKDAQAHNILGIIYQNKAKAIFDQRNRTDDLERVKELDKKGKELLKQAMTYYQEATEIEPDNKEYWKSLFEVYTTLGMDKKAKEAMNKAGMN